MRQRFIDWCNEISENHAIEGVETLKEENLIRERCIIFQDYVFYEHETVEGKEKKPMNMNRMVNQKHFKIINECLERIVGESPVVGYDLKVKDIE